MRWLSKHFRRKPAHANFHIRPGRLLRLLIAVGAFAVDTYIPGFAAIARDLHTDPGTVQVSM